MNIEESLILYHISEVDSELVKRFIKCNYYNYTEKNQLLKINGTLLELICILKYIKTINRNIIITNSQFSDLGGIDSIIEDLTNRNRKLQLNSVLND